MKKLPYPSEGRALKRSSTDTPIPAGDRATSLEDDHRGFVRGRSSPLYDFVSLFPISDPGRTRSEIHSGTREQAGSSTLRSKLSTLRQNRAGYSSRGRSEARAVVTCRALQRLQSGTRGGDALSLRRSGSLASPQLGWLRPHSKSRLLGAENSRGGPKATRDGAEETPGRRVASSRWGAGQRRKNPSRIQICRCG
jgi:hypothetical protein